MAERAHPGPLLQSWAWGEVQSAAGWRVERVRLRGGGLASVQTQSRAGLRWGYVPRGPLPAGTLPELVAWARDRGLARLRVEPEAPAELQSGLRDLGFVPGPEIQPRHTLIVRLAADAELLASFKPKTRYNVRLAARRGVSVEEGDDAETMARLARETGHRQGISQPPEEYYRLLLQTLPVCRTYVARHEGEALAAILVAEHDGRAYYLFGGATEHKRELMPSYAVQHTAMGAAFARGCTDYDMWGIPPAAEPHHPWFGLWQFKTGFGGEQVEYAGSWDLKISERGASLLNAQEALLNSVRRMRVKLINKPLQRFPR